MSEPMVIDSGMTTVALPMGSFELDLIEACREIDRIAIENKRNGDEYAQLEQFQAWISKQTAGQIILTLAQTDRLIDSIRIERFRQKKMVAEALSLPSSMDSIPSGLPPASD